MKQLSFTFILLIITVATTQTQKPSDNQTIYQFTIADISGKPFDLSTLKGKKVVIVNTASKCDLTSQYKELEALYEQYKDKDLVIVGFPTNSLLGRESGNDGQIAFFCNINYGASFPVMSKMSVRGKKMHPLYQFLAQEEKNGVEGSKVQWNSQKYLIGEGGRLEKVTAPRTLPSSEEVIQWIEK